MPIKFKNPFHEEPTLEELQEQEERKTLQLSIAQKEMMIKKLEAEGKKWQHFSVDGTKRGIDFAKVRAWLRGTKGSKK